MSTLAAVALALWVVLTAGSLWTWLPSGRSITRPLLGRTPVLVAVLVVAGLGTAATAILAGVAPAVSGTASSVTGAASTVTGAWAWPVVTVAGAAALLTGGSVTSCVLDLADSSSRRTVPRVRRTVLRGGSWIGALERLGIVATLLAGWPEGIAVILAVKGLARYPELKTAQSSGAAERFIIGTFASIGWAAVSAGVAVIFLGATG